MPGASPELRARALAVHERLCETYECPVPYFHDLDPLSELVSSLLSHRTRNADSARAFRALRERFGTWEAVRDAPAPEVEAAIAACTWPEQKAPRLQKILELIGELPSVPVANHDEVLAFVEGRRLMGRGLGWDDMHLLASAVLAAVPLWTADKNLSAVARTLGANA